MLGTDGDGTVEATGDDRSSSSDFEGEPGITTVGLEGRRSDEGRGADGGRWPVAR